MRDCEGLEFESNYGAHIGENPRVLQGALRLEFCPLGFALVMNRGGFGLRGFFFACQTRANPLLRHAMETTRESWSARRKPA
jgi:hypothetical protein